MCPGRLTRGNGPLSCLIREGAGAPGAQVGAEGDSVRVKLGSGADGGNPGPHPGTLCANGTPQSDPPPACGDMLSVAAPTKRPGGPSKSPGLF